MRSHDNSPDWYLFIFAAAETRLATVTEEEYIKISKNTANTQIPIHEQFLENARR